MDEDDLTRNWGKKTSVYYGQEDADLNDEAHQKEALLLKRKRLEFLEEENFAILGIPTLDAKIAPLKSKKKKKGDLSKKDDSSSSDEEIELPKDPRDDIFLTNKQKLALLRKEHPELVYLIKDLEDVTTSLWRLEPVMRRIHLLTDDAQKWVEAHVKCRQQYILNICFYLRIQGKGEMKPQHPIIKKLLELRQLLKKYAIIDPKSLEELDHIAKMNILPPLLSKGESSIRKHEKAPMLDDTDIDSEREDDDSVSDDFVNLKDKLSHWKHVLSRKPPADAPTDMLQRRYDRLSSLRVPEDGPRMLRLSSTKLPGYRKLNLLSPSTNQPSFTSSILDSPPLIKSKHTPEFKGIHRTMPSAYQNILRFGIAGQNRGPRNFFDSPQRYRPTSPRSRAPVPPQSYTPSPPRSMMPTFGRSSSSSTSKFEDPSLMPFMPKKKEKASIMNEAMKVQKKNEKKQFGAEDLVDFKPRKKRERAADDDLMIPPSKPIGTSSSSSTSPVEVEQPKSKKQKKAEKELEKRISSLPQPEEEVDGKRLASKNILSNRGLMRSRKKTAGNARVSNRTKYEKALKKRKGDVLEMREGAADGATYGGEETGVRATIKKSKTLS